MSKETMTPRERWQAVLTYQKPDRVPMDYWGTPEATARLIKHLGLSRQSEQSLVADLNLPAAEANLLRAEGPRARREMLKQLHVDFVIGVAPRYIGPPLSVDTDVFGCRYQNVDYGAGRYAECVHAPLAGFNSVEEIEANYTWPNSDWWDYSEISSQIRGWESYPIQGGYSEPLLKYKELRGERQAFMDLVLNPEIVQYCIDKLVELAYTETTRIYEQIPGQVMLTYVAEDLGGQENLLYSPAHIRKFLLPGMKRMIALAHQAGAFVFHHDDGNCRRILPDLVESGIDLLNPIQWRCKDMGREGLKRDFGSRLVFHGGMDNQQTLPFGTVAEVQQEVIDNLRILGADGGYILGPCHNIQVVSPPENIITMYETGYEYGWAN